jgi:hypothetical protein
MIDSTIIIFSKTSGRVRNQEKEIEYRDADIPAGDALRHKLVIALVEHDKQIKNLNVVSSAVNGDVKRVWKKMIQQWIEDPSVPNLYTLNRKGEW